VHYVAPSTITEFHVIGGSGRVILRYTTTAVAAAGLPTMGSDTQPVLTIAAISAVLGGVMIALSRRKQAQRL